MKTVAKEIGVSELRFEGIINKHLERVIEMDELFEIYKGELDIKKRKRSGLGSLYNFKYAGNHAKYITTIVNSYFIGNPPKYSFDTSTIDVEVDSNHFGETEQLDTKESHATLVIEDWYKKRYVADHDFKMGKNLSIAGKANELLYADPEAKDNVVIKIKALDPRQAFLVIDDDLESSVLAGVYYFKYEEQLKIFLYTDTRIEVYLAESLVGNWQHVEDESSNHYFGAVPLIEYYNNDEMQGDFEQVVTLINAYNVLMSERINDKQQLIDSILVITGGKLPTGWEKLMRKDRILNLPADGSKATWLERALDESSVEVLRKAIKEDIAQFSFVPNLSDENFAGNASGVAMSYKLIGLDLLIKEKETSFSKGLRLRLKRLFHVWTVAGQSGFDYESINIEYNHSLPTSYNNIYEVINQLRDFVSDETLLSQIDFVTNAQDEINKVREQRLVNIEDNQKAFSMTAYREQDEDTTDDDAELNE